MRILAASCVLFSALFADGLVAQGFGRAALAPLAVDHSPPIVDKGCRAPHCTGTQPPAPGPTAIADRYWYWNRGTLLPRPEPRPMVAAAGSTVTGTSAGRSERSWLFEAARSPDASQRALAIYAIGCAGPASHGYESLVAALDDDAATVRHAALLALGEHAGTKARFRLVRAMNETGRTRGFRRTAALAFGMACAVDGGGGGRALRRFVAAEADHDWRSSACAADLLSGGNALSAEAANWLGAHSETAEGRMPAMAVAGAIAEVARDQVVPRLRGILN